MVRGEGEKLALCLQKYQIWKLSHFLFSHFLLWKNKSFSYIILVVGIKCILPNQAIFNLGCFFLLTEVYSIN